MLVVIASHLPPAVRGKMKLWFVEPKPNVFVSGISDRTADDVVDYLFSHCPVTSGLLIFQKQRKAPGYSIRSCGVTDREIICFSGMQLILENPDDIL